VIAVDWGTTSCRAYRLRAGVVIDRRDARAGIMHVERGAFGATLRTLVGGWLAEGEDRILLGGMIGSRSGWIETSYVPCPVSPDELAGALVSVPFDGAMVRVVPGVSGVDTAGVPEFMRGEEAQIFGADIEVGTVCLPGSHSKWVEVAGGRIAKFTTFLTGEAFSALRSHTILARSMSEGPTVLSAFDAGVLRSAEPGGVLHHLFGVRALALIGRLTDATTSSYLSGLLVGHELRAALVPGSEIHVIGGASLTELYGRAILASGGRPRLWTDETAARGLSRIGDCAQWT
jgi:2-dehydro-3-deoxygalactonokinase